MPYLENKHLKEYPADLDQYPDIIESDIKKLRGHSQTIGDLHGNTMKAISALITLGFIKFKDKKDYSRLNKIYKKSSQNYEDLESFEQILNRAIITNHEDLVCFIGDTTGDRGSSDLLNLILFKVLAEKNVNFNILLSNHDEWAIRIFKNLDEHIRELKDKLGTRFQNIEDPNEKEKEIKIEICRYLNTLGISAGWEVENEVWVYQTTSLINALYTLTQSENEEKQKYFSEIIKNIYFPKLQLLHCEIDKKQPNEKPLHIYSHAPIPEYRIFELLKTFQLEEKFGINDFEDFKILPNEIKYDLIQLINQEFKTSSGENNFSILEKQEEKYRKENKSFRSPYKFYNEEKPSLAPIFRTIWDRWIHYKFDPDEKRKNYKKYKNSGDIKFIYGHTGEVRIGVKNYFGIDTNLGRPGIEKSEDSQFISGKLDNPLTVYENTGKYHSFSCKIEIKAELITRYDHIKSSAPNNPSEKQSSTKKSKSILEKFKSFYNIRKEYWNENPKKSFIQSLLSKKEEDHSKNGTEKEEDMLFKIIGQYDKIISVRDVKYRDMKIATKLQLSKQEAKENKKNRRIAQNENPAISPQLEKLQKFNDSKLSPIENSEQLFNTYQKIRALKILETEINRLDQLNFSDTITPLNESCIRLFRPRVLTDKLHAAKTLFQEIEASLFFKPEESLKVIFDKTLTSKYTSKYDSKTEITYQQALTAHRHYNPFRKEGTKIDGKIKKQNSTTHKALQIIYNIAQIKLTDISKVDLESTQFTKPSKNLDESTKAQSINPINNGNKGNNRTPQPAHEDHLPTIPTSPTVTAEYQSPRNRNKKHRRNSTTLFNKSRAILRSPTVTAEYPGF